MRILHTQSGLIEISEANESLLKEIQSLLPYGFYPFAKPINGCQFGFVVKCESKELLCIKQQPIEVDEKTAFNLINLHHLLILESYIQVVDKIGDSIYYATPYIKNKGERGFESGIAHLIYPQSIKHEINNGAYERFFGDGATDLFMTFARAYQKINKSSGFNVQYLGLDIRSRSQIGALISGFMIYKGHFIYHGTKIQEGDPRFELLSKKGIKQVIHTSSVPMEIRQDQLNEAKGIDDDI